VALMGSMGADIRTFSVGVGGNDSYDERSFARIVADRYQTHHTEVIVRAEAWAVLNRLIWHLDQPMADSSAVPTYLISQAAREHVTVVLTGDAGDEVFGGYERFMAALLAHRLPRTFQRTVGGIAGLLPSSSSYFSLRRRIERFSAAADEPILSRYHSWVSIFGPDLLDEIVKPEIAKLPRDRTPASNFYAHCEEAGNVPLLHRLQYANFYSYLHDDLLVKVDRMSMANSLEARCPFLDTQLIEEVATLPPSMKTTPFGTKRVLKKALRGLVPDEIIRRRKHGFGVPVDQWFRAELKNPFRDVVLGADARVGQALDVRVIERMFRAHQNGGANHGSRLWTVLALELWLRMLERPPGDRPPEAAQPVQSVSDSDTPAE
jgi:asparagine synthase (glutamine-hydrolysing)